MNARAYRLDAESQLSDTERSESRAAAQHDRRDLRRIGDRFYEADRVPDERDVEWGESA